MTKPSPQNTVHEWTELFMHRSMRGWHHFARAEGLSMQQISILMQLYHKGACGVSDISERFDITNAAASQLVEKLVQSGHLARAKVPSDLRAKALNVTAKGLALLKRGREERRRWMDELFGNLYLLKKTG
jgi:DNA-binding MarR family transcriptional regulator